MKQRITIEQINELSEKQLISLGTLFVFPSDASIKSHKKELAYFLTIGKMIEFLCEHKKKDWAILFGKNLAFVETKNGLSGKTPNNAKGELCDGLWEALKEIL